MTDKQVSEETNKADRAPNNPPDTSDTPAPEVVAAVAPKVAPPALFESLPLKDYDQTKLLELIKNQFKLLDELKKKYAKTTDPKYAGRIISHNQNGNPGSTLRLHFEGLLCPNYAMIENDHEFITEVLTNKVNLLIFAVRKDFTAGVELARIIIEDPSLPRIPTVLICYTPEDRDRVAKTGFDQLFDFCGTMNTSRVAFDKEYQQAIENAQNKSTLRGVLGEIRTLAVSVNAGQSVESAREGLDALTVSIEASFPQNNTMAAELGRIALNINATDYVEAKMPRLLEASTSSLSAALTYGEYLLQKDGIASAVKWFLPVAAKLCKSSHQAWIIGMQLVQWKTTNGLKQFLNYWMKTNTLEKTPFLYCLCGHYYKAIKDLDRALVFYKHAVAAAPLYPKFMLALANAYYATKDYRSAEQYYDLIKQLPLHSPLEAAIGSMRCMFRQNRARAGEELYKQVCETYPNHPLLKDVARVFIEKKTK